MDILTPAVKNETEGLANIPLQAHSFRSAQQASAIAHVPEKEILICAPHSPLPAGIPDLPQPSWPQYSLCINPKMDLHMYTHSDVLLLDKTTWPFLIAPVDLEG